MTTPTMTLTITDETTGAVEAVAAYDVTNLTPAEFAAWLDAAVTAAAAR